MLAVDNRIEVGKAGCIAVVAAVLKTHASDASVVKSALDTLYNMIANGKLSFEQLTSIGSVASNKVEARKTGCIALMATAMKMHIGNPDVVKSATDTLCNICIDGVMQCRSWPCDRRPPRCPLQSTTSSRPGVSGVSHKLPRH